jgi:flavin reductase (DIM6/NTAB) family NADH-FMN oxidoreductase RutF
MPLKQRVHRQLRKLLLGPTDLPAACDISLESPQEEIRVWLHGRYGSRDVTFCHSVACAAPFIFCIGFDPDERYQLVEGSQFLLRFEENFDQHRLLGEIEIRLNAILDVEDRPVGLFETVRARNHCVSGIRLAGHDLFQAYETWKGKKEQVKVSRLDSACNAITFICPRPVVLVSLRGEDSGSIFPMNLLGGLGGDYFAFALTSRRQAAPLVKRLGQLALSTVPLHCAATVRQLARNHYAPSIDWDRLPFPLRSSKKLDLPIPEFAIRVHELQVCDAQDLGSHTFFLARILEEQRNACQPEFHMIHGLYAACRRSSRP